MSKLETSKYEEQRMQKIAENRARLEALGLSQISSIFKGLIQNSKKRDKEKVEKDDEDYILEDEEELESNFSSEDNNDNDFTVENAFGSRKRKVIRPLRLNSKRVSNGPFTHVEKQVNESQLNKTAHASETMNVEQVESNSGDHAIRKGRGHTINAKFKKKKERLMAKGKNIDIQFPPPFYKICGKHAKYFKSEAQVCIRQKAPLQVNSWSEIAKDDVDEMWKHMKDALSLSDEVKEYAMKQIQSQYKNKLYHLHQLYLKKKGRPKNVSPDDWNWLINNKWSDLKFQERSLKNKVNRSKQEMKSITGTKSIVQKAFEMKQESKADEWPNAMEVWKATRMRSNGTWCIPNGEQIMEDLKNVSDIYQENISEAPVPLVEHFAIVLGRKPNHSIGVGSSGITKKFSQKQFLQNQLENAQNRANNLDLEVQKLTDITKKQEETNIQLQIELQSQRELIDAQQEQMKQNVENEVKRQIANLLGEM